MPLSDYMEFVEPLRLPCRGKTYDLPAIGIKDAVTLIEVLDPASDVTIPDAELERILLGPALEQMREDNVPSGFIVRCTLTALADFRAGRDVAEQIWESGADPKALAAMVGGSGDSTLSPSTDEASSTPSPASTSTTRTSRPSTPPKTQAAGGRSGGSKSSSSGRSSKRASTTSTGSTSSTS